MAKRELGYENLMELILSRQNVNFWITDMQDENDWSWSFNTNGILLFINQKNIN